MRSHGRVVHRLLLAAVPFMGMMACSDEPEKSADSKEVRTRTSQLTKDVALQSLTSLKAITAMESMDTLGQTFELLGSVLASEEEATGNLIDPNTEEKSPLDDPAQTSDDLGRVIDECLLADANIESSDLLSVSYLLKGAVVCPCVEKDIVEPELTTCINNVDDAQLRLRVTLTGLKGIDVEAFVGPQKYAPLTLQIRENSLAVEAALGDLYSSILFLDSLAEEPTEDDELPEDLSISGRVRVALVVNGEADVTASVAIVEAVNISGSDDNGVISVSLGATNALASIHAVGGENPDVTLALDAGAIDISVPWATFLEDASKQGNLALHVAGAQASLQASKQLGGDVTLSNLGLGDSTSWVKKDGVAIFSLDINQNAGRHFDLTLSPEGDDVSFLFDPGLEIVAAFNLAHVASDLDDVPEFFLDETITIDASGDDGAKIKARAGIDAVEVQTGSLTISSQPTGGEVASVSVPAGECLLSLEEPEGDHPLLGYLKAGTCEVAAP